jgi:hypothetical protein
LFASANCSARDHLLRVLASTLSGSDVHKIIAANGLQFPFPLSRSTEASVGPTCIHSK